MGSLQALAISHKNLVITIVSGDFVEFTWII